MSFRHVDPTIWRWVGWALNTGRVPVDDRSGQNMSALRAVLELGPCATVDVIERELRVFVQYWQGARGGIVVRVRGLRKIFAPVEAVARGTLFCAFRGPKGRRGR
jgi:hypothetical protein